MTMMAPPTSPNSVPATTAARPGADPAVTPLWPQKLPVVGVTGEYKAGKTLFVLTIDPGRTLYYDTEKSGETYDSLGLGFRRVDVFSEMLKKHSKGYKPVDLFLWWLDHVRGVQPGAYTVVALDTVSEIESGLADWVAKNPQHFGHTAAQYQKMQGVFWGDVKEYWKSILSDLASRCQTFAFTSHLKDKWNNAGPTGKRIPKGKETLMELASLYLLLDRKADAQGKEPTQPAATVLKSRLVNRVGGANPLDFTLIPTLPARLPVATPAAIRQYMLAPAGARAATAEELAPEERLSDDDRLRLQAEIATAQRDTEAFRLEQQGRKAEAVRVQAAAAAGSETQAAAPTQATELATAPTPPPDAPASAAAPTIRPVPGRASQEQLDAMVALKLDLEAAGLTKDQWLSWLAPHGVQSARDLPPAKADQFIAFLREKSAVVSLVPDQAAADQPKGGEPDFMRD